MTKRTSVFFHPFSHRMHMVLIMMLGWSIMAYMKINLGMAITCMVNSTAIGTLSNSSVRLARTECGPSPATVMNNYGGALVWSPRTQNLLFSAQFWGALLSNMPAGYLADRSSPRNLILLACVLMSVSNLVVPLAASLFGALGVFVARFVLGIGDGFGLPAANWILSRWVPSHEMSQAGSLFTAGFQVAGAFGMPVSAAICASRFKWPAIFYLCGGLGLAWALAFYCAGQDSPQRSRVMSRAEKRYLAQAIPNQRDKSKHAMPWAKAARSLPLWACLYSSFCFHLLMMFVSSYTSTFFKEVLYLKMMDNGFYSALPHIGQLSSKILWSVSCDYLRRRGLLSPTASVRISQVTASMSAMVTLLLISRLADCSNAPAVGVLFVALGLGMGPATSGFYTSLLSLAPAHTGTLTSMSVMVGAAGMLACAGLVSLFRADGTAEEWRRLLHLVAALMGSAALVFGLFGSGEPEAWALSRRSVPDRHPSRELDQATEAVSFRLDSHDPDGYIKNIDEDLLSGRNELA